MNSLTTLIYANRNFVQLVMFNKSHLHDPIMRAFQSNNLFTVFVFVLLDIENFNTRDNWLLAKNCDEQQIQRTNENETLPTSQEYKLLEVCLFYFIFQLHRFSTPLPFHRVDEHFSNKVRKLLLLVPHNASHKSIGTVNPYKV